MRKFSPGTFKFFANLYGPFLGAGVRIDHVSSDWKEITVSMKLRWYNRNAVGTHFGGSLYSMVDPHLMIMLMQLLGEGYVVWDKAAEVEFVSPGRGTVTSTISIEDEVVHQIKDRAESGEPYLPEFVLQIVDDSGKLIAKVKKTLYVRKRGNDEV